MALGATWITTLSGTLPGVTAVMQPWNRVVWPDEAAADPSLQRQVWDVASARKIPAVGRALGVLGGLCKQMPMDDYRGSEPLRRPRLLDAPDPTRARSWFVEGHIVDYLLHGNAVHEVTVRDAARYPAACLWHPAATVWVGPDSDGRPVYWANGRRLDSEDVVHVQRGADPMWPWRGVGVVEEHLASLDRVALEETYERATLAGSAVPSVVVIAPQKRLDDDEADDAATRWEEKFAGPKRRPVVLPNGTEVRPLGWSPTDAQLVEARKLSLVDVANIFNIDGYWLGAETSSHTYRSPGPLKDLLITISANPLLVDFEGVWSMAWLPHGRRVRFDRTAVASDDFAGRVAAVSQAMAAVDPAGEPLMSRREGREYLGLPPDGGTVSKASPVATE